MKEVGAKTYAEMKQAGKPTRYEGSFKNNIPAGLDPKTGRVILSSQTVTIFRWLKVEVDTETGAVRVLKMTSAVEPGTIINSQALEGQMEGGMDQGVGFSLREEYILGKTKDYISFKFPTIKDSFDSTIITRETPRMAVLLVLPVSVK